MQGSTAGRQQGRTAFAALLLCCLAAVSLAGCAHAAARTTPDIPGLEMPAPPPRDVEPAEVDAPPPVGLPAEPPHSAPPRPRPATPAPRNEPRAESPKPEPPPAVEAPKPPDEPVKPPTTLQTTPANAEGEVERGVRTSLQRALADLNRVDYRALNTDARTQYDTAKRFVRQADDAIRTKNLVFAKNLAEKAATIAAQLAGR